MKDKKNILLTVLSGYGMAFGIVICSTFALIICSAAYAFFAETTITFPFNSFSIVGGDVGGVTGLEINYRNSLFSILSIVFVIIGFVFSMIKFLLAKYKIENSKEN